MKKVLCLIYPNFSLYEVVGLTSTLGLSFGVEVDYAGSARNVIRSEDGLACQPTRTLDEVVIEDYSCVILPGMINIVPALHDEKLISFLKSLKQQEILIAAISSAPILLARAGLLNDTKFTGGIWQNFLTILNFYRVKISKLKLFCKIRTSLQLLALHIKRLREKCFLV